MIIGGFYLESFSVISTKLVWSIRVIRPMNSYYSICYNTQKVNTPLPWGRGIPHIVVIVTLIKAGLKQTYLLHKLSYMIFNSITQ